MNEVRELSERQARLEGIIEQLDRRLDALDRRFDTVDRQLSELRAGQRWLFGLMFTSWLSIVGLILWKLGG